MTWVKLDDGFTDHPKVIGLSDRAFRVHVRALCYCGRFSPGIGEIPLKIFKNLGATPSNIRELLAADLWEIHQENGVDFYYVHDFELYNPAPAQTQKAVSGRLGGLKSGEARRSKVLRFASSKSEANDEAKTKPRPDPTRPVLASYEAKSAPAAPRSRKPRVAIQPMTEGELSKLTAEYPDFDVGAELENCRNIPTWEFGYVAEYGALRNRLRLKRADRAPKGGTNGNGTHRARNGPDQEQREWFAQLAAEQDERERKFVATGVWEL